MTTLVAFHDPDLGTFIGADSQATMGHMRATSGVLKWVTHPSGWAAAGAGPLGAINLMREQADKLFKNLTGPIQFAERLKAVLHRGGFMPGSDEPGPLSWGVTIVLASPTGVWDFDTTFAYQAIEPRRLWAQGSGQHFALGAGEALKDIDIEPQERLHLALKAAATLDVASGGDLWIGRLTPLQAPAKAKAKKAGSGGKKRVRALR